MAVKLRSWVLPLCGLLLLVVLVLKLARLGWSMLLRYLHRMLLLVLSWVSAYTYRNVVLRERWSWSWSWSPGSLEIRVLSVEGRSLIEAHASPVSWWFPLVVDGRRYWSHTRRLERGWRGVLSSVVLAPVGDRG